MTEEKVKLGLKWEYKIEMVTRSDFTHNFNVDNLLELGYQGWEAVGTFSDANLSQSYVLFKRPIK